MHVIKNVRVLNREMKWKSLNVLIEKKFMMEQY